MFILLLCCFFITFAFALDTDKPAKKVVIAHRGASGYLPEHTAPAKAMAHAQGADYIEQDLVMTKDDRLLVLHDIHLDTVTDVAERFPDRKRADGRYYAIDFTLEEIQSLRVSERFNAKNGKPVYPGRYPKGGDFFQLLSFEEELELIQGLNKSTGREAGIYPEMKAPAFHAAEGKDIVVETLEVLKKFGYTQKEDNCYVQCFDPAALIRMRSELNCELKMVQLIGENSWSEADTDYDAMKTANGLQTIATYADGIGPWIPQVVNPQNGKPTELVGLAKQYGLQVHPYTMRADDLPEWAGDFNELAEALLYKAGADGAFSDFPDLLVNVIRNR